MDRKIVTWSTLLLVITIVASHASAEHQDDYREYIFTDIGAADFDSVRTMDGDEAQQQRDFADSDGNGAINQTERQNHEEFIANILENDDEPSSSFDGETPQQTRVTSLTIDHLQGTTNDSTPIDIAVSAKIGYPAGLPEEQHVFRFFTNEDLAGVPWTIQAPPDYIIAEHRGLLGATESEDSTRITGENDGQENLMIRFALPETEDDPEENSTEEGSGGAENTPPDEEESQNEGNQIPGFRLAYLITGILMAFVLTRRRTAGH